MLLACLAAADPRMLAAAGGSLAGTVRHSRAPGGILEGKVTIGAKLQQRRMRFSLYPDLNRRPSRPPDGAARDELMNVVVFVHGPGPAESTARQPPGRHVMEQRDAEFVPRVLPVLRGTTVEFPNADPMFHNVFSLSRSATFDLGRYPKGASRTVRFDDPGVVKVFCHIHSDMSAAILVLENPHFAVPDESGRFRIEGIAPGEYEVSAWHDRARPIRRKVRIRAGETTSIDFNIPLTETAPND